MQIDQLLDAGKLVEALEDGHVTERSHPEFPLSILNYTAKCQYDGAWDDVTRQCRGLIYDHETGEVVARPWPKFFNYGEHEEGSLDLDAPCVVYDKIDGSLGILYLYRGRIGIATRGSFDSEQAQWATKCYRDWYSAFPPQPGWTFLFEIVYPGNRIVVDYGGAEGLFALGGVSIETGLTCPPPAGWIGPRAAQMEAYSLREALALEPRANAEGVVVVFPGNPYEGGMPSVLVKIKQDDYVELHRLVTGLSPKRIWERLGAGETTEEIVRGLPDEIAAWARREAESLLSRFGAEYDATQRLFLRIDGQLRAMLPPGAEDERPYTRKEFAAQAVATDRSDLLFKLLDGEDIRPKLWARVRPVGEDARTEEGDG